MAIASCGVLLTLDQVASTMKRHAAASGTSARPFACCSKPSPSCSSRTVFAYQTANGAMLPFLAQARTAAGADPGLTTGVMTVVSQTTMVGAALLAARVARGRGHAGVLSLALGLVVIRGVLRGFRDVLVAGHSCPVARRLRDGPGGVAVPALVAEIMNNTGHANAGLGGVMTAYGAGATVSPLLAGLVAQHLGFPASFLVLAAVAAVGLAMWMAGRPHAGHGQPERSD